MFCTLSNNAARVTETDPKQPVTGPDPVPINVNGKTPFWSRGTRMGQWVFKLNEEEIARS